MELVLDPPRGVGALALGMTSAEARAALAEFGPLQSNAPDAVAAVRRR